MLNRYAFFKTPYFLTDYQGRPLSRFVGEELQNEKAPAPHQ